MIGSLRGDAWLTKSGSLLLRRSEIYNLTLEGIVVGLGWFESEAIWKELMYLVSF
jgi:hypothetical protein